MVQHIFIPPLTVAPFTGVQAAISSNPPKWGAATSVAWVEALCYASYLGVADRDVVSAIALFHMTAVGSNINWAECAIASGDFVVGTDVNLTIRGWVDISTQVGATQNVNRRADLSLSGVVRGMHMWALLACSGTTRGSIYARNIPQTSWPTGDAGSIESFIRTAAGVRPSTMSAGTTFATVPNSPVGFPQPSHIFFST